MSVQALHALGNYQSLHLGKVVDNQDPENRGRIQVKIVANELTLWAHVMVASAGSNYGQAILPKIDEMVVLAFISQDQVIIMGSIWTGDEPMFDEVETVEDNYVIKTPAESVLAFKDQEPKIEIQTRSGYQIKIDESSGGAIEIVRSSESIKLSSSGIEIMSQGSVSINAMEFSVSASTVRVDSGQANFTGTVIASTVNTPSVVGATYTPGAGNIW